MRSVRYESNHNRAGEQEALRGVEVEDGVVQNLDARWLLYQTRDDIDEQKVDDQSGPHIVPLEVFHPLHLVHIFSETLCFLQNSPQVALNPHRLPSRVIARHLHASCSTCFALVVPLATTTVSLGLGCFVVTIVLCLLASNSRLSSLDRRSVSASFSGMGWRWATASS